VGRVSAYLLALMEAMASQAWNFYLNMAASLSLTVTFFCLQGIPANLDWLWILAGFLAWGPFEYMTHRWFFHSPSSPSHKGHGLHHRSPLSLLAVPFFFSSVVGLVLYQSLTLFLPGRPVSLFLSGMALGYFHYGLIHHTLHHSLLVQRVFAHLYRHHELHHRFPRFNFGVSTTYLDRFFGTRITEETRPDFTAFAKR